MNYSKKYKEDAIAFQSSYKFYSGTSCWESPSNIALIKYWGKKDNQLPQNPSLSFTLDNSLTKTRVNYIYNEKSNINSLSFFINGIKNQLFEERVAEYLIKLHVFFPYLKNIKFEIISENNFPHSAGIASSASSFSALALCLTDIENQLKSKHKRDSDFYRKAPFISRLGSGSAARSVYGGAVLWGKTNFIKHSSDEVAIPVKVHNVFNDYRDVVLIVDNKPKEISSSKGHELMNRNPYKLVRFKQASQNLEQLLEIMKEGDTVGFSELIEYEALSLHAMMMTSYPGSILVNPNTLSIIKRIRELRFERNIPVAFTLDAGAIVHILCPGKHIDELINFVKDELLVFCQKGKYIINSLGSEPKRIK